MSFAAMGWLQNSLGIDITGEWNRLVHLTVGGMQYCAQRKTFRDREVTLCRMVLDDALPRAEDGSIVIDRDGSTFRHVLTFLRSGELLLPDGFDEWDLLMNDAATYGVRALEEAINAHPTYQRRQFRRALPPSVYLRFDYRQAGAPPAGVEKSADRSTNGVAGEAAETQQQQQQPASAAGSIEAVHLVPALPMLSVCPDTGALQHQGREVASVDEAVAILLGTYEMHVAHWDKRPACDAVFLTLRSLQ